MVRGFYGNADEETTLLAKGVLIELFDRLPDLRERSALGGGLAVYEWVERPPDFVPLYTADVDLVVEMSLKDACPDLRARLLAMDDSEWEEQGHVVPFSFGRKCRGEHRVVRVDFQGPERSGGRLADRGETLCPVGDLQTRVLEGGILAVQESEWKGFQGIGPAGDSRSGKVRLIRPFILALLKAVAFEGRGRRSEKRRALKDAADLYALLQDAPGGVEALARQARRCEGRKVVQEGIGSLRRCFTEMDAEGVDTLVEYFQGRLPLPQDQMRRELVELANAFLEEFRRRQ